MPASANILGRVRERVAGVFVTKTVYAATIAVGAAGITYPFFPRHLTIISTLTIGVPGFFLALAAIVALTLWRRRAGSGDVQLPVRPFGDRDLR